VAKLHWASRWDFRAGLRLGEILFGNMFYLNEKLIRETPGAPGATYGETSKEIDAQWRARFHA
jgi:hypothetical protein